MVLSTPQILSYKVYKPEQFHQADGEGWQKVKDWFAGRKEIRQDRKADRSEKVAASGGGLAAGMASGATGIWGAVAQTAGQIFAGKQQKDILEAQQELAQQQVTNTLIANRRKQVMPLVIVGGVLLIGGVVVASTLLKK